MDTKLLGYIISLAIMVIWGVAFYLFKRNDKRKDDSIALLFEASKEQGKQIIALEGDIKTLRSENKGLENKLWKEEKLIKLVSDAIENEFLKWENKWLKKGVFNINK